MHISGKASWNSPVVFHTYHDHRMAMAFAPLSLIKPVDIEDPKVVGKSYVSYWDHLTQMGASISLVG